MSAFMSRAGEASPLPVSCGRGHAIRSPGPTASHTEPRPVPPAQPVSVPADSARPSRCSQHRSLRRRPLNRACRIPPLRRWPQTGNPRATGRPGESERRRQRESRFAWRSPTAADAIQAPRSRTHSCRRSRRRSRSRRTRRPRPTTRTSMQGTGRSRTCPRSWPATSRTPSTSGTGSSGSTASTTSSPMGSTDSFVTSAIPVPQGRGQNCGAHPAVHPARVRHRDADREPATGRSRPGSRWTSSTATRPGRSGRSRSGSGSPGPTSGRSWSARRRRCSWITTCSRTCSTTRAPAGMVLMRQPIVRVPLARSARS